MKKYIRNFKNKRCSIDLVTDFQNSALQTLCSRMRAENLCDGYIMIPVPRTVYYTFVYPKLNDVRFWSAHYGDWAIPQFRTRVVGSVNTLRGLRKIFGARFVKPKQQQELSGYNSDLKNGALCGYLLFLNYHNMFTFSYNHQNQVLKFSFSYLIYRWLEELGNTTLQLENGNESEFGVHTAGFPAKGLRVQIWWSTLEESYKATVKRWSTNSNTWVLNYDSWQDSVVEDVSVQNWEFIE